MNEETKDEKNKAYSDLFWTVVKNNEVAMNSTLRIGRQHEDKMSKHDFVDCVVSGMATTMCSFFLCNAEDTPRNERAFINWVTDHLPRAMEYARLTHPSLEKVEKH